MNKILVLIITLVLSGCSLISSPPDTDGGNDTFVPPAEEPAQQPEPEEPEKDSQQKDTGIFNKYRQQALNILDSMSTEEKIGQMFLVRCPDEEQLDNFLSMKPGGFILFGKDFLQKTKEQVTENISYYQKSGSIPMIIGVDEEGGTVVRVSLNPLLATEKFKSPQELYAIGGFEEIKKDAKEKSQLLLDLGINLNLAPVADVSENESDFINLRTLGKSADETSEYVINVVEAMKETGISSTLKHFPGYGNNTDTHNSSAHDSRPYEQFIKSDFLPFKAGIEAGAESILVSHNIVEAIGKNLPASLSKNVIDILRNDLNFTGIIMTDDLSMGAIAQLNTELPPEVMALMAGNDMIIVTDFENSFNVLLNALEAGDVSKDRINESVLRILQWKCYMNLM
ncbi:MULTISPECIES: glycoside hydrolase family 3 N-terminal domain-containing protein [unclassified Sedimentibacter]|uniref:glycoside hydrolase family 3 N-terminal domain-containing protein n=1 Tax=unclassified Sedimentibacter TaxID=2649220 RepID=UPI0027DFC5C9|nr:glycoside hydrolase family 3 N-terminal domain-containing protein [Sedimentibacter sp. MB35-C1]WMJ78527.1 glycoside hydrolase family 3 N-terminal domain-containing protein [Sedimentibacter sp. MB35-C1]